MDIATGELISLSQYYEYEISNGSAILTKYIGSEMADIVVPSRINGYPVTKIGPSAFEGQALTGTLTLPEGLLKIGDKAFSNCNTLTGNLVIPNSVEEIGAQAFYMGGNMADRPRGTLTLGQNLKTIGDRAFVVNANTAEYSCSQGYTGTLTIPSGVQKIGSGAFNGNVNLTGDLILPDTITEIGSDAFAVCGFNGRLQLLSQLQRISSGVFYQNGFSGDLVIPASVTRIERYAFAMCSFNEGIIQIPESVTYIGEYAFANVSANSIKIPYVETIASYAFDTLFQSGSNPERKLIFTDSRIFSLTLSGSNVFGSGYTYCQRIELPDDMNGVCQENTENFKNLLTDQKTYICTPGSAAEQWVKSRGFTAIHERHVYSAPVFTWAEDGKSCSAVFTCLGEDDTQTVQAGIESRVALEAACESKGKTEYTAVVTFEGSTYTDKKTIEDIEAAGHNWKEAEYAWSEDRTSVTARRVCVRCEEAETETRSASWELTQSPTETEKGERTYTSEAFENPVFALQTITLADIPAIGEMQALILPDDLAEIGEEAFSGISCECVIIPDGGTRIGRRAFAGCTHLLYVSLPSGSIEIGSEAFTGCGDAILDQR